MEVLEVCMNTNRILMLNTSKYSDSKYRINKKEQEEQASDICKLLNSPYKSIEQDSKALIFLNDFENSTDSEGFNDSS